MKKRKEITLISTITVAILGLGVTGAYNMFAEPLVAQTVTQVHDTTSHQELLEPIDKKLDYLLEKVDFMNDYLYEANKKAYLKVKQERKDRE